MEDIIKDEVVASLRFHNGVWGRRFDAPVLNSDGNLVFVLQDDNKEGILDIQREAYKTYLSQKDSLKKVVAKLPISETNHKDDDVIEILSIVDSALSELENMKK